MGYDAAEFRDIQTNVLTHLRHVRTQILCLIARAFNEHLPATTRFLGHIIQPAGVQFASTVFFDKLAAVDARLVGQFHHGTVDLHDPAVDTVKLINQRLDPIVVQVQFIHQIYNFRAQCLICLFFFIRHRSTFIQGRGDTDILHFGQTLIVNGDTFQRFQNLGF